MPGDERARLSSHQEDQERPIGDRLEDWQETYPRIAKMLSSGIQVTVY